MRGQIVTIVETPTFTRLITEVMDAESYPRTFRATSHRTSAARWGARTRGARMKEDLFEELTRSVREGGRILRGEEVASRSTRIEEPDVAAVRERFGLSIGRVPVCHRRARCDVQHIADLRQLRVVQRLPRSRLAGVDTPRPARHRDAAAFEGAGLVLRCRRSREQDRGQGSKSRRAHNDLTEMFGDNPGAGALSENSVQPTRHRKGGGAIVQQWARLSLTA